MNWFARQRILWIAETLRVFGFINREHLVKKFGISVPKASADLAVFQENYPDACEYDRVNKRYVAKPGAFEEG